MTNKQMMEIKGVDDEAVQDIVCVMKVKVESEKVGLKLNIQKMKIMASGPINSWGIDGETVETVSDFIFLGSKITADGDCNHENKRCQKNKMYTCGGFILIFGKTNTVM